MVSVICTKDDLVVSTQNSKLYTFSKNILFCAYVSVVNNTINNSERNLVCKFPYFRNNQYLMTESCIFTVMSPYFANY